MLFVNKHMKTKRINRRQVIEKESHILTALKQIGSCNGKI